MIFECHICGFKEEVQGPYNNHFGGHLTLGQRWQLDLCRSCVEHLFQRAPEAGRIRLLQQAFGQAFGSPSR